MSNGESLVIGTIPASKGDALLTNAPQIELKRYQGGFLLTQYLGGFQPDHVVLTREQMAKLHAMLNDLFEVEK